MVLTSASRLSLAVVAVSIAVAVIAVTIMAVTVVAVTVIAIAVRAVAIRAVVAVVVPVTTAVAIIVARKGLVARGRGPSAGLAGLRRLGAVRQSAIGRECEVAMSGPKNANG